MDKDGQEVKDLGLSSQIFGAEVNPHLVAQAVKVYLNNQRKAYPKAKSRSEVSGSRKKIWPQKGTGRARHGDKFAPIFVGGGVAHGPKGNQNYSKKLPKKMKRKALVSALSAKQKEGKVKIVKGIKRLRKTNSAYGCLQSWFGREFNQNQKYLLVLPKGLESAKRAFRNLPYLDVLSSSQINCYQVLDHHWLILTPESVDELNQRLLK